MVQGGDIVHGNGTGGECIWGEKFADENFLRKHIGCGIMSYVSKGRHTNASQFLISLGECPWLDGQYVVFGQVLEGFDILQAMAKEVGSVSGQTKRRITIADCGAFNLSEENQALLQASLSSASIFVARKETQVPSSNPTKALDDKKDYKQSKVSKIEVAPLPPKKIPVKKPLDVRKPMASQASEDFYDDGSSAGSQYIFGQLRTLQFQ